MEMVVAKEPRAVASLALVRELQEDFVCKLKSLATPEPDFARHTWLRAGGDWGGGDRLMAVDQGLFNRATINVSQVQYEGVPERRLASATALSTIVHPMDPRVPSIHIHISWTQMKSGDASWRLMADLNPAIPEATASRFFDETLQSLAGPNYELGCQQGQKYFFIPALARTRGVSHFYLEGYQTGDFAADLGFARTFGKGVTHAYREIVAAARSRCHGAPTAAAAADQLAYHTLYLLQVLTLDRGTIAGLMVHDQNDLGIMGSLPAWVDRELLASWLPKVPASQEALLQSILAALPPAIAGHGGRCCVDDDAKVRLAQAIRDFYQRHPEATDQLARGDVLPTTMANHSQSAVDRS